VSALQLLLQHQELSSRPLQVRSHTVLELKVIGEAYVCADRADMSGCGLLSVLPS
jgi:hypothetical protein